MRALLLTIFCFAGMGATFHAPFLGILMWHWLSLGYPQHFAWGFTAGLPIIMMNAVLALLLWVASAEPKRLPRSGACIIMILLMFWVSLTTPFAVSHMAVEKWVEVVKILGMTLVTICVATTRMRLIALVWVAAISLGFWGIKGGLWGMITGGGRVQGPHGTFIADNNTLGLALLMILPLWLYLAEIVRGHRKKLAIMAAAGVIAIGLLLTYSRGAAVGFAVVGLLIWWSSRRRVLTAIVFTVAVAGGLQYLPSSWFARMDTINTYDEDGSATNRLDYWQQAISMGRASPIIGYGFKAFLDRETARMHRPGSENRKLEEAHSVYFQVLGEQGFVGLGIFAGLILVNIITAYSVYRRTKRQPELFWAHRLARALTLSGIAFAVSGAFLSHAYYDLFFLVVAMTICLQRIVRDGEAPPRIDNFPLLLERLRVNTTTWGLGPQKPEPQLGPAVPALTRS